MSTVYAVGNNLFAVEDLIFGWSLAFQVGDWTPIGYTAELNLDHLNMARKAFAGPVYPQGLRDALDKAIAKTEGEDAEAKVQQERAKAAETAAHAAAEVAKDAAAVEAEKQKLANLYSDHQWALSRLAIYHLRSMEPSAKVTRTIAFLKDQYFELSRRDVGYSELYLTEADCQVTVKRPSDPKLVELLDGLIPFTK